MKKWTTREKEFAYSLFLIIMLPYAIFFIGAFALVHLFSVDYEMSYSICGMLAIAVMIIFMLRFKK